MGGHRFVSASSFPMGSYWGLDEFDGPDSNRTYNQYTTPYSNIPFYSPGGCRPSLIRNGDIIWGPRSTTSDDEEMIDSESEEGAMKQVQVEELKQQRDAIDTHSAVTLYLSDRIISAEQAALLSSQTASAPASPTSPTRVPKPNRKTPSAPAPSPLINSPLMDRSISEEIQTDPSRPRRMMPKRSRSCPGHRMPSSIRPPIRQVRFDAHDTVHVGDKAMEEDSEMDEGEEEMSLSEYFLNWKEEHKIEILGGLMEETLRLTVADNIDVGKLTLLSIEEDKIEILGGLMNESLPVSAEADTDIEDYTPLSSPPSADTSDQSSVTSDVLESNKGAEAGPQVGVTVPVG